MLWYKSWLETRWRFGIGLAVLMIAACGIVVYYPTVVKLIPLADAVDAGGSLGQLIRENARLAREFRGYVWSQWTRQTLPQLATLFAALLGSGGLLSQSTRGTLFALSMPASRARILGVRAGTGLAELFSMAVLPFLLVSLFAPAVGQRYGLGDAIVHALCVFFAMAAIFSFAFLLSSAFNELTRPLLITCAVAVVLSLSEQAFGFRYGIYRLMSGESYFRSGALPWGGALTSAVASAAMLYGATVNIAQRDF
jgi:hypothetical protein